MTTLWLAYLMPYSSSLVAAAAAAMLLDPDSGGDVEAGSVATNLLIPTKGAVARKLEKPGVKAPRDEQIPKAKVLLQSRNSLILTVCRHYPPILQGPLPSVTVCLVQVRSALKEISSWVDLGVPRVCGWRRTWGEGEREAPLGRRGSPRVAAGRARRG